MRVEVVLREVKPTTYIHAVEHDGGLIRRMLEIRRVKSARKYV
jgi:hypothetical protein